jgi:farnesyl-diphosphate farnesyltransferase
MTASRKVPLLPYALLREVSRSFYLTLRVLPGAIRPQVGLAYLLARTTDTLADTEVVPVSQRLAALEQMRARILGAGAEKLELSRFLTGPRHTPEQVLLGRAEELLAILTGFTAEDQELIRAVLRIITSGQELDLRRFSGAGAPKGIVCLTSDAELEDYIYRVAGCVGEFWTRVCRAHLFPEARVDEAFLLANGARFGKGLQLVNVLRDLPCDLRQGRCYLPVDKLAAHGLNAEDLLEPARLPAFRPLYDTYLARAESYLADGWAYTNALPRQQARVRLACAWPILIGLKTLAKLRAGNALDPSARLKVSRAEVRRLVLLSVLCHPWRRAWESLFAKAKQ